MCTPTAVSRMKGKQKYYDGKEQKDFKKYFVSLHSNQTGKAALKNVQSGKNPKIANVLFNTYTVVFSSNVFLCKVEGFQHFQP